MKVFLMKQAITAKLKLELSDHQKQLVRRTTLAYRDALNHASSVAFENNKMSSGVALQKKVYNQLRSIYGMKSDFISIPQNHATDLFSEYYCLLPFAFLLRLLAPSL